MDETERKILIKAKQNFPWFAEHFIKIRTKDKKNKNDPGTIKPFILNSAQLVLMDEIRRQKAERGFVRIICVKGRQMGISTFIDEYLYHDTTFNFGVKTFIMAHEQQATDNIFDMVKMAYDFMDVFFKPAVRKSNTKELSFEDLESGYKVATANNKNAGRSSTNQNLHISEGAFFKNWRDHAKGIMQTVPRAHGTHIFIESTANGMSGGFYEEWNKALAGKSDYTAVFLPWFWMDEYRADLPADFEITPDETELQQLYGLDANQLAWRRLKMAEFASEDSDGLKEFRQEYPCNAIEAFQMSSDDVFIDPDIVMKARKNKCEAIGPKLIGVDIARKGKDRTAIIRRQGRVASNLQTYKQLDTNQIIGRLVKILEEEKPDKMFIDGGYIGAAVCDILIGMGFQDVIVQVDSGSASLIDPGKYLNMRAQMWGEGRKWLVNDKPQIPDIDSLHADLCNTKQVERKDKKLQLESKIEMRKRGISSSDEADALLLTFAWPMSAFNKPKQDTTPVFINGRWMEV